MSNQQNTTEFTELIDLKKYMNLLDRCPDLKKQPTTTLTISFEIPVVLLQTLKLIATLRLMDFEEFLRDELLMNFAAVIDNSLGRFECSEKLIPLIHNLRFNDGDTCDSKEHSC